MDALEDMAMMYSEEPCTPTRPIVKGSGCTTPGRPSSPEEISLTAEYSDPSRVRLYSQKDHIQFETGSGPLRPTPVRPTRTSRRAVTFAARHDSGVDTTDPTVVPPPPASAVHDPTTVVQSLSVVSATVVVSAPPRHASSASDFGDGGMSPGGPESVSMILQSPSTLGSVAPFTGAYDSGDESAGEQSPAASPGDSPRGKAGGGIFSRFWGSVTEFVGCSTSPCSTNKAPIPSEKPRDFTVSFEDIDQVEMIGSGAMGCVYKGVYDGVSVAIKKFRNPDNVGEEVRDLKSLSHVNIVRLLGVCIEDPVYCIVMELCLRSVNDVIKGTRIGPELVCNWAKQVACGMEYLHGKRIVHRDLKTPNVLVGQDERTLKISDFGTSRKMNGSTETKMSFCGSVAWMAPEMIKNQVCTGMVDVWSFGVVLWELLTGQQPYDGVDQPAILYGIGTGNFHLPVPSTTPTGFSLLLKQCWNVNPQHRPKFRQILLHLQIVEDDSGFLEIPHETFFEQQSSWRRETKQVFSEMKLQQTEDPDSEESLRRRRERELKHAEDIRRLYEERLADATSLLADLRTKTKAMSTSERKRKQGKRYRKTSLSGSGRKRPGLGRTSSRSRSRIGSGSRSGNSTPQQMRLSPKGSKAERLRKSLERAVLEVGVREALADLVRNGDLSLSDLNDSGSGGGAAAAGGGSALPQRSPLAARSAPRKAQSEPHMGGMGGGRADRDHGGAGGDPTESAAAGAAGTTIEPELEQGTFAPGVPPSGDARLPGGTSVAHIPDGMAVKVPLQHAPDGTRRMAGSTFLNSTDV